MLYEAVSRMPDVFNEHVLLHGQACHDQEKVLNIRLSEGLMLARVKGSGGQIYNVHIDLKVWPSEPARCACRAQINCKHAAAALISLYLREKKKLTFKPSDKTETMDRWLQKLTQKQNKKKELAITHRLVYLLEPDKTTDHHRIDVKLAIAKKRKNGALGKKFILQHLSHNKQQQIPEQDQQLLDLLIEGLESDQLDNMLSLKNTALLSSIIDTGHAFFDLEDDTPIPRIKTKSVRAEWSLQPNGLQRFVISDEQGVIEPLILDKVWHVDEDKGEINALEIPYPVEKVKELLNQPALTLDEAAGFGAQMQTAFPEFPTPKRYCADQVHHIKPRASLIFDACEPVNRSSQLLVVEPGFYYGTLYIAAADPCTALTQASGEILRQFPRAFAEEKRYIQRLKQLLTLLPRALSQTMVSGRGLKYVQVIKDFTPGKDMELLCQEIIPQLEKEGWQISFKSPVYQKIIQAEDLEWFSDSEALGHNQFFSYRLGILIDGEAVSIVPLVVQLLKEYTSAVAIEQMLDETLLQLPLDEHKRLEIKAGRIKPLLRFLLQYGLRKLNPDHDHLEINPYQMVLMQEAEQAMRMVSARWQGTDTIRERLKALAQINVAPIIPPKGLTAKLRDYQLQGLNWLQLLREHRFGGILADDMGLGKTIQALAQLLYEKEQGRLNKPALIIAPTSLIGNWATEAKRFTPALKTLIFHGTDRHDDEFDNYDLIISTYGLIQRDKQRFVDYGFYYLILDEAQFIKNARTKTTQIIQQIQAQHRLCLTGTPLENHLGELWSLFHFLMPGLLGDNRQFRQWFRTPIEKEADMERKNTLVNRVRPFMLRRKKSEVAKELPLKTEIIQQIDISGPQRDLYEAIRMSMEKKVREAIARQGLQHSQIVLLDALLKLRQVCCDPGILNMPEAQMAKGHSAKLDALMELLDNLMQEGRHVLIFSQFTSMLKLIEAQLIKQDYTYLKLTGQTKDRQSLVERFQNGEASIFLISLKAGGTGLNLSQADTVIHYDPWWNPAVEDQATDRSHRIGQDKPVFVYKLICSKTVEEVIQGLQLTKRHLAEGVLSAHSSSLHGLSEGEIDRFFAALPEN